MDVLQEKVCACQHTRETEEKVSRLNEITTNRFFQAGSLDVAGRLVCERRRCLDNRAVSVLQVNITHLLLLLLLVHSKPYSPTCPGGDGHSH